MDANPQASKEDQIMRFLHEHVFDPVLLSPTASPRLKQGVRQTINRMKACDASGMVHFFWASIKGTERAISFSDQMKAERYDRFEEVFEEFRRLFDDKFLRKWARGVYIF